MNNQKIISVFSSKGGVGKSTVTNLIANELIYRNTSLRVLVIDIDAQASIFNKRDKNNKQLSCKIASDEFKELASEKQKEILKLKKDYLTLKDKGYNPFRLIQCNTYNPKEVENCINLVNKQEYDYIFIDFPGTFYQEGVGEFLRHLDYMVVPITVQENDILGTEKMLLDLFSFVKDVYVKTKKNPMERLKEIKLLQNKSDSNRKKIQATVELELLTKFKDNNLSFFETRIPNKVGLDTNTIIPISVKIDTRDGFISKNEFDDTFANLIKEITEL